MQKKTIFIENIAANRWLEISKKNKETYLKKFVEKLNIFHLSNLKEKYLNHITALYISRLVYG